MAGNTSGSGAGGSDRIEERLIDDRQEGQQNLVDAANEAFVEDQRSDDHPTRQKRQLAEERGVEDPSHSQGSPRDRT